MNIERKPGFEQVCVWQETTLGDAMPTDFEGWMRDEFGVVVQFLEIIITTPDIKDGRCVPETGGRHDLFFAVESEGIGRFAVPRLKAGIRWIEDVLAPINYRSPIYPERVREYCCWETSKTEV